MLRSCGCVAAGVRRVRFRRRRSWPACPSPFAGSPCLERLHYHVVGLALARWVLLKRVKDDDGTCLGAVCFTVAHLDTREVGIFTSSMARSGVAAGTRAPCRLRRWSRVAVDAEQHPVSASDPPGRPRRVWRPSSFSHYKLMQCQTFAPVENASPDAPISALTGLAVSS